MTAGQRVVVACPLAPTGFDLLGRRFVVEAGGTRPERSWLHEHVPGAVAIVADPSVRVDAELLDLAGNSLKVVANFAVGYDNIDLEAARARDVRATNTPDVLTNATAELAIALMLAAARRIAEADASTRSGEWREDEDMLGRELSGATVGLVGFGRIARRVAELLRCFEVRLLVTLRSNAPLPAGIERRGLHELLAASDFVSIHVPLTTETRHLIDARALGSIKPGAILVNTSRGAVVDTLAVIDALRSGRVGAAGLDVYENEPHLPSELLELPNTVLLPHVGSATAATRDAMARLCAENVIAVIEGREPPAPLV
jgi:glyoxylate reductase